jgi:thioesterase domain-containing protein/acyl carrier protein
VEIRGFRVEPEGVETVIRQHPAVRQATVFAREDGSRDKRLVAYVVGDREALQGGSELRSFLKERLPGYMVPAVFMFVESLPLTPNGKVDYNALPPALPADFSACAAYVPPQTNTEIQLVRIWQNLLGVPRVGVTDNFFELGGSSLLAVRLFALIEETFDIRLPVSTIFHDASIQYLANALDQHTGVASWPSLVPIQPHGSKAPLFFVHPFAGDVIAFKTWADYLGDDQPFYGLRAVGLDGIQEPLERIEDIAARYLSEIKLVQPAGPYYLGGYCAGSPIAFEMAQQLCAEGQQVALVAIVNFPPPQSGYRRVQLRPELFSSFIRNLPFWVRDFVELNREEKAARVRLSVSRTIAGLAKANGHQSPQKASRHPRSVKPADDSDQTRPADDRLRYAIAFRKALDRYVPRPYPGRVVVFKTQRQPLICSFDDQLCWGPLATGGVDVEIIPGSNTTMFKEPYAHVWIEQLRKYLDGAQAPHLPAH